MKWEDPYGGQGIDTFALINDARTLVHTTSIKFEDEAKNCTYKYVVLFLSTGLEPVIVM